VQEALQKLLAGLVEGGTLVGLFSNDSDEAEMSKPLAKFLTALDAAFLYVEKPRQAMHIGSIMVYEGRLERKQLERLLLDRLHLVPRYRERVVFPPWNASTPMWFDDPDFDIANHVDEVELTPPVDDRTLAREAARVYGGMLDRKHPLWKLIILHGLPDDHTAVVWKVHHAMVDGVSGIDLTMALHDFRPDAEPPAPPAQPWQPPPIPDPLTLLQQAVEHTLTRTTRSFTEGAFDLLRPDGFAARASGMQRAAEAAGPSMLRPMPPTPWNRPVSGELDYAWVELSWSEVRATKGALGGTVNDLVLAILAGGLGRYLRAKSFSTSRVELRAMCPVSMRQPEERGQLGNVVSALAAPLFVGVEDPLERMRAERAAMESLKEAKMAEALHGLTRLTDWVPPAFQAFAAAFSVPQPLYNTVSTNVPGPQIPLYIGGRRLLAFLPLGIVSNNLGLFVSILSYERNMTFGLLVDAKQIPDVPFLADCLRESYRELREAAGVAREEPADLPDLGERWTRRASAVGTPARSAVA
jgi:diacylglycerol O-acyltransferase / wax synthase